MWSEITYPFPNFNGATVGVWEWISNFIPHYNGCNYLSMIRLKLNHVSERDPGYQQEWCCISSPRIFNQNKHRVTLKRYCSETGHAFRDYVVYHLICYDKSWKNRKISTPMYYCDVRYMACEITDNSPVYQSVQTNLTENIAAWHCRPFVMGRHQW